MGSPGLWWILTSFGSRSIFLIFFERIEIENFNNAQIIKSLDKWNESNQFKKRFHCPIYLGIHLTFDQNNEKTNWLFFIIHAIADEKVCFHFLSIDDSGRKYYIFRTDNGRWTVNMQDSRTESMLEWQMNILKWKTFK